MINSIINNVLIDMSHEIEGINQTMRKIHRGDFNEEKFWEELKKYSQRRNVRALQVATYCVSCALNEEPYPWELINE